MNISFQKYIFVLVCAIMMSACHNGRTYFPKDLEAQEIDIVRFDYAIMNVHESTVAEDIRVLYDEYPVFMPLWVEDILGIPSSDTAFLEKQLPLFLNDTTYGFKATNARERIVFSDIKALQTSLSQAFTRIQWLYPETEIPHFYLFISGFQTPIYFGDEIIGIGGDMYL